MQKVGLLFLSCLLCFSILAQEPNNSAQTLKRLSFSLSTSIPVGDFAKTDATNSASGYAEDGRILSIQYQYQFADKDFLVISYLNASYDVDIVKYAEAGNLNQEDVLITADGYKLRAVTAGYKYGKELKGYINPFLGFGTITSGKLEIKGNTAGGSLSVVQKENDPILTLLYGFNAGVELFLSNNASLIFEAGIIGAKFEIDSEIVISDNGALTTIPNIYDQPYMAINASIGLGIHF